MSAPDPPQLPDELADHDAPAARGSEIEGARVLGGLAGANATAITIARSRIAAPLTGSRLRSVRLVDVLVSEADCSNADWIGGSLKRVAFERCRMTGFGGGELSAEDVVFRGCKLDLSAWRNARLRRCRFEDCVLDEADFAAAWLQDVAFAGCRMGRVDFDRARLARVDLRGSELIEPRGDVTSLRGAIIAPLQLLDLAPALAAGLGITVSADDA